MTMQFLASVRRNQRQWMAVLTILAIFAFLMDDVRGASSLSTNSTALFIAVLCAGGMSIIGYPRGHTVMYGLVGFLVGGSAAWVGSTYSGPLPPVRTSFGSLTREKIQKLQAARSHANQFIAALVAKVNKEGGAPSFGDTSLGQMTHFAVLRHEADRMGVSVSDEAVSQYIQEVTNKKLTEKDYIAVLKEQRLGEAEMFDLIRNELEAQIVGRLISPPSNIQQLIPLFTQRERSPRTAMLTPEQLWEDFRKLNVRQSLSSVALPVTEFIKPGLVPEPSESELKDYFDKRKNKHGDERGNPGFLEYPKVKLAYLMAYDLEAYEKGLPGATDEEVVNYYLAHKEEYRIFDIPDTDTKVPDLKGDPDAPADAESPANASVDVPAGPAPSDPPAADKSDAAKPPEKADPEKKETENKDEAARKDDVKKTESDEKPKDEPKCDDDEVVKKTAAEEGAAKAEAAADPQKPDAEDKPAADKPAADKPAADKPAATDKPAAAAKDETTPPEPALPGPGGDDGPPKIAPPGVERIAPPHFAMPPAPRYRDLDDTLKLQIREKILLDKAFEKMGFAADDAFQFMIELSMKYLSAEKGERAKLIASFPDECKAYAKKNGLEYRETKEMTQMELATSLDEKIGSAGESVSDRSARQNLRRVSDMAFESFGTEQRDTLYTPQRADSPKAKYAYWKIAEIKPRVPDLADKATRQLVVDAWKFEKGRELAEKRAKELAALMKASILDPKAALADQTINGTKDSPLVVMRESSKFSWLNVSRSVPSMGMQYPVRSFIDSIDQAGPDFYKLIFEQLSEGEIGIGINYPRTTVYVVRVHDRDGAAADGGVSLQELQQQFMKERFTSQIPTPYDYIASEVQQVVDSSWQQSFSKQFGITYEDDTSKGAGGQ